MWEKEFKKKALTYHEWQMVKSSRQDYMSLDSLHDYEQEIINLIRDNGTLSFAEILIEAKDRLPENPIISELLSSSRFDWADLSTPTRDPVESGVKINPLEHANLVKLSGDKEAYNKFLMQLGRPDFSTGSAYSSIAALMLKKRYCLILHDQSVYNWGLRSLAYVKGTSLKHLAISSTISEFSANEFKGVNKDIKVDRYMSIGDATTSSEVLNKLVMAVPSAVISSAYPHQIEFDMLLKAYRAFVPVVIVVRTNKDASTVKSEIEKAGGDSLTINVTQYGKLYMDNEYES